MYALRYQVDWERVFEAEGPFVPELSDEQASFSCSHISGVQMRVQCAVHVNGAMACVSQDTCYFDPDRLGESPEKTVRACSLLPMVPCVLVATLYAVFMYAGMR